MKLTQHPVDEFKPHELFDMVHHEFDHVHDRINRLDDDVYHIFDMINQYKEEHHHDEGEHQGECDVWCQVHEICLDDEECWKSEMQMRTPEEYRNLNSISSIFRRIVSNIFSNRYNH